MEDHGVRLGRITWGEGGITITDVSAVAYGRNVAVAEKDVSTVGSSDDSSGSAGMSSRDSQADSSAGDDASI